MQYRPAFHSLSRGFAPRTPLHALSLAATSARSVRVARSRARSRVWLRPSDSPARSLARRYGRLPSASAESYGETSPKRLRREGGPFAWLARALPQPLSPLAHLGL